MQESVTGSERCPFLVLGDEIDQERIAKRPSVVAAPDVESWLVAAPFGPLSISARGGCLVGVDFVVDGVSGHKSSNPVLEETERQLSAYFQDPNSRFNLPLQLNGTRFMRRAWQALLDIPAGSVETYGSLAQSLGSCARAIGSACRANLFPLIIPCHRVISARGLGGYCGHTSGPFFEIKCWLLRHEGCALD
ncbi:methylated-DNA--[protein]-cysteine S-methyltransferase [Methylocaldum sp.]|uniref:methylated-DNA--[protein]-cysteine S-methyltransferase n=1 Tax=Methylocaldum sp. TaxID=1969727 RepID=UPI0039C901CB